MKIFAKSPYVRAAKKFPEKELAEINAAIARLPEIIGQPHRHSGAGVRRLRPSIFEIRAGLDTRVIFLLESGDVVLLFADNHDEVRRFLKNQ